MRLAGTFQVAVLLSLRPLTTREDSRMVATVSPDHIRPVLFLKQRSQQHFMKPPQCYGSNMDPTTWWNGRSKNAHWFESCGFPKMWPACRIPWESHFLKINLNWWATLWLPWIPGAMPGHPWTTPDSDAKSTWSSGAWQARAPQGTARARLGHGSSFTGSTRKKFLSPSVCSTVCSTVCCTVEPTPCYCLSLFKASTVLLPKPDLSISLTEDTLDLTTNPIPPILSTP